ncbi:hypothetical protein ABVK25_007904 [Lepraria finkii]|uniref:Major facilitator superfamily (MFS) profile domain-containing protein n=1 Tax=Lepraria finkii TaxID=1340010 RepID=A0ABR4B1G8_9LECA
MVVLKAVAIIGTTFPLERMRNQCLGLFGVGAPDGGWAGALVAGLLAERVPFKWLFIFMALLGTLVLGSLAIILPSETPVSKDEKMDWVGSALGTSAPKVGWTSPYEIILLILSILLFLAFTVWEYRFTTHPIMPLTIFRAPSFAPVIVVVLLSFMSLRHVRLVPDRLAA